MKKSTKRFVISTEASNAGGFRVRTQGIEFSEFMNNPLLLFMHVRPKGDRRDEILPLGYWEDIKVSSSGEVSGVPVFDDTDDFAIKIFNKVENGTLKMASAGLKPGRFELKDGDRWLEESILKEASIVDIGLNKEALSSVLLNDDLEIITLVEAMKGRAGEGTGSDVRKRIAALQEQGMSLEDISKALNAQGEDASRSAGTLAAIASGEINNPPANLLTFLNKIKAKPDKMKNLQFSAALLPLLKLAEDADDTSANAAVMQLLTLAESQKAIITTIESEKKALQDKIDLAEAAAQKQKCVNLAEKATTEGRITKDQEQMIIELAEKDFAGTEKFVATMPASTSVASRIGKSEAATDELIKMSWDDLDKANKLVTLKEKDIDAFKLKYQEKFGKPM